MLLPNSAHELPDIPPIPCKNEEQKMLSLDQLVTAQNAYKMSETAVFEPKINGSCIAIWDQSDGHKQYLAMCRQHLDATHFLTGACGASSICTSK